MPARIYDISKKLGIDNKEVLVKAKAMGIAAAKVPSSSLDKISAEWLEEELIKEIQIKAHHRIQKAIANIKAILELPGLGFRYQYEVLPEGLLPRFIVQTNAYSEANPEWRWRTGAVLEWNDCRAVVRADYQKNWVEIFVTGPEARRRELLAVIREKFEDQHRDLKGLTVEERVPVPGEVGITVNYRDLLKREEREEEEFYPEKMDKPVLVQELLNGVETPESRKQRREKERNVKGGDTFIFHAPATVETGDKVIKETTNIIDTNYGQIGEVLNDCKNIINQQPPSDVKELLAKLQSEVESLIKQLPDKKKEETADELKSLVEFCTAKKPIRKFYSVSAEGLLEASKFAKDFTGNIAGTIGQLGKLLWPDFGATETKE